MILSDRTIREKLASGEIVIEPLGEDCIQPSSVDLHVDRYFRVFRNHTMRAIDVKERMEDLTELIEIGEDDHFVLHPGEFVLGSTAERVAVPDDLVARIEGKSSLGRLGLLIHSSLPASEEVLAVVDGELRPTPIGDIVAKRLEARVAAFDPETFRIRYASVTGWYEGPADRIFEVRLASGRSVRVTAGHNLFTLGRDGAIAKVRTVGLESGARVAIPRRLPDPCLARPVLRIVDLVPEAAYPHLVVEGPTVGAAFARGEVDELLRAAGLGHVAYYRGRQRLPFTVAKLVPGLMEALGAQDRVGWRGGRNAIPAVVDVHAELAWLLGIYVAEGYRRAAQVVVSNTDNAVLDRAERAFATLGLPVHRVDGVSVTCCSSVLSALLDWLGAGGRATEKRLPPTVFGWPEELLLALFDGMLDGDGSRESSRTSYWTSSPALAGDVLLLAARLGLHAAASVRTRPGTAGLFQVQLPGREHKLLTAIPVPDRLLVEIREERLDAIVNGDLAWDEVVEVVDTGRVEPIYDIEVRPDGEHLENFLAGTGGVFVSNTAGFVDAGFDGHLTLELSNVANLPITLYPGMKIGQISFLQMTTPADVPYGSKEVGSKYQGQRGPTPSRYFENFKGPDTT